MESIFYRNDDTQPRTSARYEPDYQTDHLIEFMGDSLKDPRQRPFFGMICYGPPHPPLLAPEAYSNRYSPEDVPINSNTPEDAEARAKARAFLAKYYGLVASVDDNIGRVVDWIDTHGLRENTLIIVVSDHGDMAGEHGLREKKTYYRSSMQVPFIVRYWEFNERGAKQAVRYGKWKLIRHRNRRTGEHTVVLYDLEKDIGETKDLAMTLPEVVSEGTKLMDAEHVESPYYPIAKTASP